MGVFSTVEWQRVANEKKQESWGWETLFAVSCHIFLHQTTVRDIGHNMRPQKLARPIDCVCSGPSPRSRPPRRRMRCAEETNKNSRNSHKCARAFLLVDAQACSACNDVRSMPSNALCMWSGLLVCATNAARAFRGRVSDSGSLAPPFLLMLVFSLP
jgi:hypothetical protein